jgi:NADH:ubiquinone oxidoreductase subunit F (NADH-binding)/(2Fe-2S) ferredoxin
MNRYRELAGAAGDRVAKSEVAARVRIQVGSATCENAAGAVDVLDEFRKHIRASGRHDISLRQTGCTGRCSCEPIVGILTPGRMPVKYEKVDRARAHEIFTQHVLGGAPVRAYTLDVDEAGTHQLEFFFCGAARCGRELTEPMQRAFEDKLRAANVPAEQVAVRRANCFGLCDPLGTGRATRVLVRPDKVVYTLATPADLDEIIAEHIGAGRVVERLRVAEEAVNRGFFELYGDVSFFRRQTRVALRNSGVIDPESLDEALRQRAFEALAQVLDHGDPTRVRAEIRRSRLRGRGGGGYLTGLKWDQASGATGDEKFIICNADEGDPGAFMDRSMLEGDPYAVIEGMLIGAYAIGAHQGYFYVRAEYPLAVRRIENALAQCRSAGLLGQDILGSGFDCDLEIRLGAGAFVCGEETALIHSIEGERGQPRVRPPYPTTAGLWGRPTCINNVETFANVPAVLLYGADWFAQLGTAASGGTKVFALAGKVQHTGLVEVPMGTTLREVVYDIGGGVRGGKQLKAVQTGGPAGGCLRAEDLDTPVDFDTLQARGSIMGSGGMIVLDEDDCVVDLARYYMSFSQHESCGKCTPCREGTKRMLEILERIVAGKGQPSDLERLERLAELVRSSSLCGLGRAAPNPVLSTLRYFRSEYAAHVAAERTCPAHRCRALLRFEINDKCVGCTLCARRCPVTCIAGERRQPHVIDQARCIQCGVCFEVCRFEAVSRR